MVEVDIEVGFEIEIWNCVLFIAYDTPGFYDTKARGCVNLV